MLIRNRDYILNIFNNLENDNNQCANIKNLCNLFDIKQFALATFHGDNFENFDLCHSYPKEWIKIYQQRNYQAYDPVFKCLTKLSLPFSWNKSFFDLDNVMQKKLYNEASQFNIHSGTTIPLLPLKKAYGFLTIINERYLHPEILYTLSTAANFHLHKYYAET